MKYIQTYEDKYRGMIYTYDKGEYVKTYQKYSIGDDSKGRWIWDNKFKVKDTRVVVIDGKMKGEFLLEGWNGFNMWASKLLIERLMTKKEIEKFELKKSTYNYNL